MSDIDKFLKENPEVEERGVSLFGSVDKLKMWLLSETDYSNRKVGSTVMSLGAKEILLEIGRIEHGIY